MMKHTRNYLFYVSLLMMLIAVVIYGLIFQSNVTDCGLSKLSDVNDIGMLEVSLEYAFDESWCQSLQADLNGDGEEVKNLTTADVIAVVSSTGRIKQTDGDIGQEFVVKNIIKGEETVSVGLKAYVYSYFGFQVIDGEIKYRNTYNLMFPEKDYLIFMDVSPLNEFQEDEAFILKSEYYGYIRIDDAYTRTIDENYMHHSFSDYNDCEFFSTSESVTHVLNEIRKGLLAYYL